MVVPLLNPETGEYELPPKTLEEFLNPVMYANDVSNLPPEMYVWDFLVSSGMGIVLFFVVVFVLGIVLIRVRW